MKLFSNKRIYVINPKSENKSSNNNLKNNVNDLKKISVISLDTKPFLTFDEVLGAYVGSYGVFQKLLSFYAVFFIAMLSALIRSSNYLILLVPPHSCETANGNITFNTSHHHEFNFELIYPTLVSENDWVCEQKWKIFIIHSSYWLGASFGVMIIGNLADKYGRIWTIVFSFTFSGVASILTNFAKEYYVFFLIVRALTGVGASNQIVVMILVTEYLDKTKRSLVSNSMLLVQCVTNAFLPWLAYSIFDWRTFNALVSATYFIVPFLTFLLPESASWLLTKGQVKEAKNILKYVARVNGRYVSDDILNKIKYEKNVKSSFWKIHHYPNFFFLYLKLLFIWLTISSITFGTNLYSSIISKHPFWMMCGNGIVDALSSLAAGILCTYIGRKPILIIFTFVSGSFFFTSFFLGKDKIIFIIFYLVGRFSTSLLYCICLLYCTEICPTAIRSFAQSICQGLGSLTALIPVRNFNFLIYGCLITCSGFILMTVPETKNCPLPQTYDDAENFALAASKKKSKQSDNNNYMKKENSSI